MARVKMVVFVLEEDGEDRVKEARRRIVGKSKELSVRFVEKEAVTAEQVPWSRGGILAYFEPEDGHWRLLCKGQILSRTLSTVFAAPVRYGTEGVKIVILHKDIYGENNENKIIKHLKEAGYKVKRYA